MRLIVLALWTTLPSGCKYDRSFMNINSDSGVPFLGLQWSVDAGESQRRLSGYDSVADVAPAGPVDATEQPTAAPTTTSPEWISTALSVSHAGPVQYSLPPSQVDDGVDAKAEIARRLAAF